MTPSTRSSQHSTSSLATAARSSSSSSPARPGSAADQPARGLKSSATAATKPDSNPPSRSPPTTTSPCKHSPPPAPASQSSPDSPFTTPYPESRSEPSPHPRYDKSRSHAALTVSAPPPASRCSTPSRPPPINSLAERQSTAATRPRNVHPCRRHEGPGPCRNESGSDARTGLAAGSRQLRDTRALAAAPGAQRGARRARAASRE